MMKRLAIVTSHPIQYNAPLFSLLCARNRIQIKVFYTWGDSVLKNKFDPGFGKVIQWDIPLLDGYPYTFVTNTASDKGSHHFKGIINPSLIEEIKDFKANAVLVFGWAFESHLKAIRYFSGKIPVFFRGDSHMLDYISPLKRPIRNLLLRYVYSKVSYAFYVGKHNMEYFRKAGLKQSQLIFAPHAIDNLRFSCKDNACITRAKEYRQELDIPEDARVILFAGKLEPKKSPLLLVEAFNQLKNMDNTYLVIAGNGPLEDEVKKAASSSPYIKYIPFQNQQSMPSLYATSDVFVLPSAGPGETWGLSVNEAMAAGKAVVVSDRCGCHSDMVVEGVNGYVFQSGNVASLVMSLSNALDLNNADARICNEKLLSVYSFETVALAIEDALTSSNLRS
jgi:glycosyltransferase involved in cell wall biosynthesis